MLKTRSQLRLAGLTALMSALPSFQVVEAQVLIDSFDAPVPPAVVHTSGPPQPPLDDITVRMDDPSILGGAREMMLRDGNTAGEASQVTVGQAILQVDHGPGTMTYVDLAYGTFAHAKGQATPLGLDLRHTRALRLSFARLDSVVGINMILHTSAPLDPDPNLAVSYAPGSGTVTPTTPGGPLTVVLPFDENPGFNWAQVDGVGIQIFSPAAGPGSPYALDAASLDSVPTAAPDTLRTRGNRIYRGDDVWVGRGAVMFDARSNAACDDQYYGEDFQKRTEYAKKLVDVLVDQWHANFIRLVLEAYRPRDSLVNDSAYLDSVREIVTHIGTKPGVFVELTPSWIDPSKVYFPEDIQETGDAVLALGLPSLSPALNAPPIGAVAGPSIEGGLRFIPTGVPTDDPNDRPYFTSDVILKLVETFAFAPHVLWGLANEPAINRAHVRDAEIWGQMNALVAAVRAKEKALGAFEHLVLVQGTRGWSGDATYYNDHPITAAGGTNVAYELHNYGEPAALEQFVNGSPKLPLLLGEYGPAEPDGEGQAALIQQFAEAHQIPHAAYAFSPKAGVHNGRAPVNLLEDIPFCPAASQAPFGVTATKWGEVVQGHLAGL